MSGLPTATHSSTLTIMGVELRIHNLDDGQRIIEREGFLALFEAMASGVAMSTDDARDLAAALAKGQPA